MTSYLYILDSSSLIDLHRHNPMDVYPTVWKELESLIKKDRIIAPREVLDEITSGDDELVKWAKKYKDMFRHKTREQIKEVKRILKDYPSMVKDVNKHDADVWIIALALEMTSLKQQKLAPLKTLVVTEEGKRGNRIKIPWVCEKYGLRSINIIEMFRIERLTF